MATAVVLVEVNVTDAIGAGDAFSGGFLAAYLRSAPFETCCRVGNLFGALVATKKDGMGRLMADELAKLKGNRSFRKCYILG